MLSIRFALTCTLVVSCILFAGCTSPPDHAGKTANASSVPADQPATAGYKITLAQPDARSDYIVMDSDVYNAGEVVEFTITNKGRSTLECSRAPPDFVVKFQTGSGRWATKMGAENPVKGNSSVLQKGESTQTYRFISTALEPGRYRIISDCGVGREFLIRTLPVVTQVPPSCPPVNATNTSLWITIDPVGNPAESQPFTIHGTTNLPSGTMLNYTIFGVTSGQPESALIHDAPLTTMVEEGTCGTNSWSAMGEIQATGDFVLGVTDATRKVTAILRFTVTP
jgi:hypothetical protein